MTSTDQWTYGDIRQTSFITVHGMGYSLGEAVPMHWRPLRIRDDEVIDLGLRGKDEVDKISFLPGLG